MHANVLAIASEAGIFSALIEALGLFSSGETMVRIIIAEEGIPKEYKQYCSFADEAFAYALDLVPDGNLALSFATNTEMGQDVIPLSPNLEVLRFLLNQHSECKYPIGKTIWRMKRG